VTALAKTLLLSLFMARFRSLFGLVAGAYAGFCALASFRIAEKGRHWRLLPYIPAAFACIHLPAGAGLIAGFVKQRTRPGGREDAA
jgi:hypothetical protein